MTEFTWHLFRFLHFSYKKLVCKPGNKHPCSSTDELAVKVTVEHGLQTASPGVFFGGRGGSFIIRFVCSRQNFGPDDLNTLVL